MTNENGLDNENKKNGEKIKEEAGSGENGKEMNEGAKKPVIHLFSGFLGTGKTTAIRHLMKNKADDETWAFVINEFGDIGIDGAVLTNKGIPVTEVSGGCLCCEAGAELVDSIDMLVNDNPGKVPDRIIIEASGLAHAGAVIDEIRLSKAVRNKVEIGSMFTLVDPRQFTDPNYLRQPVYHNQIAAADILVATKLDLCDVETIERFDDMTIRLFPPKTAVIKTKNAEMENKWLTVPPSKKSKYRKVEKHTHDEHYHTEGFVYGAEVAFDPEKLYAFFVNLPNLCQNLVRAKGVFQLNNGVWMWFNWAEGQVTFTEIAWRRDNRLEIIAKDFALVAIERDFKNAIDPNFTPEKFASMVDGLMEAMRNEYLSEGGDANGEEGK